MPTFTAQPDLDSTPVGKTVSTNGDFETSTLGWYAYPPAENAVSWVKYRAPMQPKRGALRFVSTPVTPSAVASLYPDGTPYTSFTSGMFYAETWVRIVGLTSGTTVQVDLQARPYTSANGYIGSRSMATMTLTPGSGWKRLTGAVSFTTLAAQYPTTARIDTELYFRMIGASAGAVGTYDVGKIAGYKSALPMPTYIDYISSSTGTPARLTLPATVDATTAAAVREATRGLPYITETA